MVSSGDISHRESGVKKKDFVFALLLFLVRLSDKKQWEGGLKI